ncbi:hypothetical protein CesoFtcFv8_019966 [Champsocephalus esox]|uniref:Integrase zinc-binding domain-containing protein n=1 Tax=Champsocephalus esox TaxID=159716 RepID=A0AAN8BFN8_9TELE|nr:hypothetical protein CesoFtcFv8_019966 [Champsocephalus esox]
MISIIREATTPSQWRYVNTSVNPADQASRGLKVESFIQSKNWIQGPRFLWKNESEWPERPDLSSNVLEDDDEVKKAPAVCLTIIDEGVATVNKLIDHYSKWCKLKRAVGWFLRIKDLLLQLSGKRKEFQAACIKSEDNPANQETFLKQQMKKCRATLNTVEHLELAEKALVRFSQRQAYLEEIKALEKGQTHVKMSSPLSRLDPVLEDGVLRVGGRLNNSAMPEEAKRPLILSKNQRVATLLLQHIHREVGHGGRNHTLSKLRQKYWIPKANAAVRRIITDCTVCRRLHAKAGQQKMADLLKNRVLPDEPPFTNVGVDYFGPFEIKRGRSPVKRYGVIFTCLAIRAVHIEVAYSLDTDSCINALRRFISRRGQVAMIRSDNGTNFVGAERELREAIEELNRSKIHNAMLQKGVKWIFNPPGASHHGRV